MYHVEKWSKKKFYEKIFVWIKEDRGSVTRPKSENVKKEKFEKWKIELGQKCVFFFSCLQIFVHTLITKHD